MITLCKMLREVLVDQSSSMSDQAQRVSSKPVAIYLWCHEPNAIDMKIRECSLLYVYFGMSWLRFYEETRYIFIIKLEYIVRERRSRASVRVAITVARGPLTRSDSLAVSVDFQLPFPRNYYR